MATSIARPSKPMEVLARLADAEAKAVIDGHHFRDDHHDEGGTDADTHAGQDRRHSCRQDHAQEHGGAGGAQVARRAQVDAVHLAHAGDGVDQHREEGAQRDQEDGRRIAQPEPQHRQRDVGDRRHRPDDLHQHVEQAVGMGTGAHGQAKRQRQPGADGKAGQHAIHAADGVVNQFAGEGPRQPAAIAVIGLQRQQVFHPLARHRFRRRQRLRVDHAVVGHQVPGQHQRGRHDQADADVACGQLHLTPSDFLACSSRSVLTQSLATGGLAILPTPVLAMVSVVTWMCSGVMSYE
jgi:hypothetical protein